MVISMENNRSKVFVNIVGRKDTVVGMQHGNKCGI
jgi:hypothetical protein